MNFVCGDIIQTPFGKGTVRQIRNNGRVLVDVRGRAMEFTEAEISPVNERKRRPKSREWQSGAVSIESPASKKANHVATEIDLHGLTVEQALARAEAALNDALLVDLPELRLIHGRSGGRIRHALHRWLASITAVRSFRLDPQNNGVTIVKL